MFYCILCLHPRKHAYTRKHDAHQSYDDTAGHTHTQTQLDWLKNRPNQDLTHNIIKHSDANKNSVQSIPWVILWLVPQASKIKRILCSDWLSCPLRIFRFGLSRKEVPLEHIKSFIDKNDYPRSFFFFSFLFISTSSRFIKTQKKLG